MNSSLHDTPAAPRIEAMDVHKSYRAGARVVEVLHGASVEVRPGEKLAIVGASGSGKSTLLNVLSGLDRPSAGAIRIDGCDLYAMPPRERTAMRARRIGFVFQAYHLLPELTLFDNVYLPARVRWEGFGGGAGARKRAAELIERVGLAARATHRPDELSGGEQQRAAIARALMNEPDILFADEPTGNLDSASGGQVLDSLFALVEGGERTVVMVTHNPDIAARCDRVLTLRDGRIG
ncbi:MAG: ABC transporter ATP-binding protein [Lentisphaerae bacterium]|nr:ABC transporter ATP-binding protein [Lentisphaerota bacterium]